MAEKFNEIFRHQLWGRGESVSGSGSSLANTGQIREHLPRILRRMGIASILDIPCGDYNWMSRTDLSGIDYIGADVVVGLIESNRLKYPGVQFESLDMVTDKLPQADVVLVRDCLVHLSYRDIFSVLENIVNAKASWLVATHFPGRTNHDISVGQWRPLDMTGAPFNFPNPTHVINEGCTEENGAFADKSLGVWRIDSVARAIITR